jgi:hypothetical protein
MNKYSPFHEEWAQRERSQREFDERKARLRGDQEIVLMGGSQSGRAAVYMDEKGRPRLNVGRKTGLSADLDYDGGPEAEVKYKKRWKFVKPQHQGGAP